MGIFNVLLGLIVIIYPWILHDHTFFTSKSMDVIHPWLDYVRLYNTFILHWVLCKMSVLELMNVIQKKDNYQCMVRLYFDLLLGVHSMKAHSQ